MHRNNSRASLYSNPKSTTVARKQDIIQLCQSIEETLDETSKLLSHHQFSPILEKLLKNLIMKAEVQSTNSQCICLQSVKQCLSLYGGSLQLNIRALLLEIHSELNSNMLEQVTMKLQKAKHLVIHTHVEYLLSKIFLLEEKYYLLINDEGRATKCIKKCIEFNESYSIEFMQEEESIRKQIVDHTIIAFYEYFKLFKNEKPQQALDILIKIIEITRKNYGRQSKITKGLSQTLLKQQNYLNSLQKVSTKSKAITDILQFQSSKHQSVLAFYSWEDQKVIVQLLRKRGVEKQIISQYTYGIKLDNSKIKLLKLTSEWLIVEKGSEVMINQEEFLRVIGENNNNNESQKQMTTQIQLRNISRDQVWKKGDDSSSDDETLFQQPPLNFLKYTRAQSSRKFKQTH